MVQNCLQSDLDSINCKFSHYCHTHYGSKEWMLIQWGFYNQKVNITSQKDRLVIMWHFAHTVKCKSAANLRLRRIEIRQKNIFNWFTSLWSTVQSGRATWLWSRCTKLLTYSFTVIITNNLLSLLADYYTITVWMTATVMRTVWQEWARDCNDAWLWWENCIKHGLCPLIVTALQSKDCFFSFGQHAKFSSWSAVFV